MRLLSLLFLSATVVRTEFYYFKRSSNSLDVPSTIFIVNKRGFQYAIHLLFKT